ncbi:MAG: hypothetical protein ACW98Y_17000 [Candidatus Thorarchaeota archaeon]
MAYDEDIIEQPALPSSPVTENFCFVLTIMVIFLMIIIGLPTFYNYINEPIPTILVLGFTALVLSILYLATAINKLAESK